MERAAGNTQALLERLTDAALDTIASGDTPSPRVLRFLLRGYAASGRMDIGDALGVALAASLAPAAADDSSDHRIERAMLFVEATGLSEDERVRTAAGETVERLRRDWAGEPGILPLLRSLDIAIQSAESPVSPVNAVQSGPDAPPDNLLAEAIDRLEQLIAHAYRPGAGVVGPAPGVSARLADQMAAGIALTSAYRVTARLPYAMLAEELLQFARRTWWDAGDARFVDGSADNFVTNCDAIRLLGVLGGLHRDEEYRRVAVFAPDADYLADAEQLLVALGRLVSEMDHERAAAYGIALRDWLR